MPVGLTSVTAKSPQTITSEMTPASAREEGTERAALRKTARTGLASKASHSVTRNHRRNLPLVVFRGAEKNQYILNHNKDGGKCNKELLT